MTPAYVPFDVWKCVAEYVSDEDLKRLRSVDRSWRLIVQQVEYRNVGIKVWGKRTKECLKALSNPARGLGQHVRALEITPWIITSPVKVYTKRAKVWNRINALFDSEYPARCASDHVKRKLAKHIDLVISTVQNLPDLHEFAVQWSPGSTYHPEFFSAFLGPILTKTKLGLNLTKLSVKVPTETLSTLAPLHFPQLACLELDLHTGNLLTGEINDLLDSLIVFVNNTTRTLRTLSVSSTTESKHLDLNRFFHLLGFFPLLTSFILCIPYDGAHISSPSFVFARAMDKGAPNTSTPTETFIKKHAGQLEELQIKSRRASPPVGPTSPHAKFWIQRILADIAGGDLTIGVDGSAGSSIHVGGATSSASLDSTPAEAYSRLQKLEVPLRPLKSSLQPLHACLQAVSVQLKSLKLTERALTGDELKGIITVLVISSQLSFNVFTPLSDALSNSSQLSLFTSSSHSQCKSSPIVPQLNLTSLSLRVQELSPKLLDFLAEVVPGLRKLEIEVVDTAKEYTPCQLAHAAMQQHRHYSDWHLRVIQIRAPQSRRVYAWSQGIESILKACIPGVDVEIMLLNLV
ncbi:hypothetical protein E1B28_005836 [Marasmius oreades]|uniref:F-box domain-containing protein n=1 Tax=Marasmius oreades TaxID=181124 RepID=A0A9P7S5G3_9AGAR|nr:uncharacterized protein E1B28_005836 [Marasmius oreades]KAG7095046.1 hypothetical protein E1B28_005836 [Marasmius oreades]